MTYGIQSWNAGGTIISTSPDVLGGLYVGTYTTAFGTTTTYTFADVPGGSYLRVYQVGAGGHTWATGTNGSSQATLTVTTRSANSVNDQATVLMVMATTTSEVDYGINALNSSGDRTISTNYPVPEFLGKITFSRTPTASYDLAEGSYWQYDHSTGTSIGSGRRRLVLWSLPTSTEDIWFTGTTTISSSVTSSYNVTASYMRAPACPFVMPEAFIFALDGLTSSGTGYGVQVFNSSGGITFDGGLRHLQPKGFETTLSFPTATGTINTYTMSTFSSGMPAFVVPYYSKEVWVASGGHSNGKLYESGVRKSSSSQLAGKIVKTQAMYEDSAISSTVYNGNSSSLVQLVIDATLFDGSSSFPNPPPNVTTSTTSGTSACSFDGGGGGGTCNASSGHTATYTYGNGGSVSYSWTFTSNAGGFYFSGGTTSSTCTVMTDGYANSGSYNYSCVLRCTVTVGSESGFDEKTVTHTSTDTYYPPITCFPAGSMVLMATGKIVPIETIAVGDFVMGVYGAVEVLAVDTPLLGKRRMMAFEDGHKWSEEHAHWTKDTTGSQWWWSANKPMWQNEVAVGAIGGLKDNNSMRTDASAFAHIDGWKSNAILELPYAPDTQLYLPITAGSPIIVDGYVVGAGVNQSGFDYETLDWDVVREAINRSKE